MRSIARASYIYCFKHQLWCARVEWHLVDRQEASWCSNVSLE